MTLIRLGYVAMSVNLKNASPSQTMTYAQFSKIRDEQAAIHKLELISRANLGNCLRLLRYNLENDIEFFRLSSKLIPLATHEDLKDWDYISPIEDILLEIHDLLKQNPHLRIDFHPDHFVLLNSPRAEVLNHSVKSLQLHKQLLKSFGIDPRHRCVIHVGGGHGDKEKALEQFIVNWGFVPESIQSMIMLENDDKVFTVRDTLYLCEKLGIPFVFDLHHHKANNEGNNWEEDWNRMIATWRDSVLPMKMHVSSPRSESDFRAHADFIETQSLHEFLQKIKGTVKQVDIMIEAKKKDGALFQLLKNLKEKNGYEWVDQTNFIVK